MKKKELVKKFYAFIDTKMNRRQKRQFLKKVERVLELFLRYLGDDPRDLEGELYQIGSYSRKIQENFNLFFKEWRGFLIAEGIVDRPQETKVEVKVETLLEEAIVPHEQERCNISVHAKVKLLKMKGLMAENLIVSKQVTENEFKNKVSIEVDAKLTRLARQLHRSSLLISEGNSKGMTGDFRYYYHHHHNLVIVEAIDEGKIVTIFESYLDPSIASDILIEKRRNKKLYESNIDELRRSHIKTIELLEYRKQQLRVLEQQEKSIGQSIADLETGYNQSQRAVNRIINKDDIGVEVKFN